MVITRNNKDEVKKIHLHDALFEKIIFNNQYDASIEISAIDVWERTACRLTFQNVVYCEIQSCNFWGPRTAIYYWEAIDDSAILQELFKKREIEHSTDTTLLDHDFFAVQIILITGNTVTIVCEKIVMERGPLDHE